MQCRPINEKNGHGYKILLPLKNWAYPKKQDGAGEEWVLEQEEATLSYRCKMKPQNGCSLRSPTKNRLQLPDPGISVSKEIHVILRGVSPALDSIFNEIGRSLVNTVDNLKVYEGLNDMLDNTVVVALLIWQYPIRGKSDYIIHSERSHRERVYQVTETGLEIEPLVVYEDLEEKPKVANEPKDYASVVLRRKSEQTRAILWHQQLGSCPFYKEEKMTPV